MVTAGFRSLDLLAVHQNKRGASRSFLRCCRCLHVPAEGQGIPPQKRHSPTKLGLPNLFCTLTTNSCGAKPPCTRIQIRQKNGDIRVTQVLNPFNLQPWTLVLQGFRPPELCPVQQLRLLLWQLKRAQAGLTRGDVLRAPNQFHCISFVTNSCSFLHVTCVSTISRNSPAGSQSCADTT